MEKLKIFICCHKPYNGYRDEVYTPIHLGRAVSLCTDQMQDMIGDDTGENISEKNPYYSEATGIYWIWKNVHDCEYVGLHHYRRFFLNKFTNNNIDKFFSNGYDVLMVRPFLCDYTNRWYFTLAYMSCEDLLILRSVIKGLYSEYVSTFDTVMNDFTYNAFNMIICKKRLYDEYAKWMFDILFQVEKIIKQSAYPNSRRTLAYMSELLTPIYFKHHKKKIRYQSITMEGNAVPYTFKFKVFVFLFSKFIYPFIKTRRHFIDPSIVNGLLKVGINVEEIGKGNFNILIK